MLLISLGGQIGSCRNGRHIGCLAGYEHQHIAYAVGHYAPIILGSQLLDVLAHTAHMLLEQSLLLGGIVGRHIVGKCLERHLGIYNDIALPGQVHHHVGYGHRAATVGLMALQGVVAPLGKP